MPSTSKKQRNFMAAVAHSPAFAKKAGVPQSVGKEFNAADKGRKFGTGGMTRPDVQKVNKPKTRHGKMALFKEGGDMKHKDVKMDKKMMQKAVNKHESRLHKGQPMTKLAKGGTFRASANGIATKGKTKGTQIKMCGGGMTKGKK
jgi:hypothetical protein